MSPTASAAVRRVVRVVRHRLNPMPNFILVGAQKAGTESLYHYLTRHPEIASASKKEPVCNSISLPSSL